VHHRIGLPRARPGSSAWSTVGGTRLDQPENEVNLTVTMQSVPEGDQLSRHHRVRAAEATARGEDHEIELPADRAMTNRFDLLPGSSGVPSNVRIVKCRFLL
jgi:hypothetical protein